MYRRAQHLPAVHRLTAQHPVHEPHLRSLLRRAPAAVAVEDAEQRRRRARARQLGLRERHVLVALRARAACLSTASCCEQKHTLLPALGVSVIKPAPGVHAAARRACNMPAQANPNPALWSRRGLSPSPISDPARRAAPGPGARARAPCARPRRPPGAAPAPPAARPRRPRPPTRRPPARAAPRTPWSPWPAAARPARAP